MKYFFFTNKNPQDVPRLQERAKSLVSQFIGATEQRNGDHETVAEELSLALPVEEEDLQDDLHLPDPAQPLQDKNQEVVPARRNQKRTNVYHEESRSKRTRRVPAKFL